MSCVTSDSSSFSRVSIPFLNMINQMLSKGSFEIFTTQEKWVSPQLFFLMKCAWFQWESLIFLYFYFFFTQSPVLCGPFESLQRVQEDQECVQAQCLHICVRLHLTYSSCTGTQQKLNSLGVLQLLRPDPVPRWCEEESFVPAPDFTLPSLSRGKCTRNDTLTSHVAPPSGCQWRLWVESHGKCGIYYDITFPSQVSVNQLSIHLMFHRIHKTAFWHETQCWKACLNFTMGQPLVQICICQSPLPPIGPLHLQTTRWYW